MRAHDLVQGYLRKLQPLPPTALRLAGLLDSPLSSVDECVAVIRYDEAITLAILTYANSAFSGASRQITDIRSAVIRLGGGRILKDILARHLKSILCESLDDYGYAEADLWRHSVAAATAVESLGPYLVNPIGGLAFAAALMHDIGKLILARAAPKTVMDEIWNKVSLEACTCEQAENSVFGFSHADVGAEMMVEWKMPEAIQRSVRNHHAVCAEPDAMTDCVSVANVVARSVGEGIGFEGMRFGHDSRAAARLGLTKDIVEKVCAQTTCRMREILSFFGV
jgi:putative nucleotidyltransferase with HDIG domain